MKVLLKLAQRIDLSNDTLERIQRYLENKIKDNDSLDDQSNLIKNLPPALRSEVEMLTQKSITKQVHFFNSTSKEFNRLIIPLLKP